MRWLEAKREDVERWKKRWLHFIVRHGNRRITSEAIQWVIHLDPLELEAPGTRVLLALEDETLIGLCGVKEYGKSICFIVVHSDYRGQNIGRQLLRAQIKKLTRLECKVALDNSASLRMCHSAGMSAVGYYQGTKQQPIVHLKTKVGGMTG
ncbi:GNAT family N-acetyltransferase [Marinicrinis lubricantis]|uniref:GNAT family N-acetyltransferase n=1 Tax=Marinicrinis lubricantis TaxID=2086470 RepID=A0ABW1IHQ7_9BACL